MLNAVAAPGLPGKRILVIADLARVPIALLLCAAVWWSSVPLAVAAIIALGVGASFYDPIASASTPNLVSEQELASAQSLPPKSSSITAPGRRRT